MPMTPTMPTARRQDLDQECPATRNMSLESQHNSAKYIRYLKLLKGEVGYNNRLRDFQPICWQISSFEKHCDLHSSGHTKIAFTKRHTGQKVRNIWQIAILQIHWCVVQNGYHLTVVFQVKLKTSVSEK